MLKNIWFIFLCLIWVPLSAFTSQPVLHVNENEDSEYIGKYTSLYTDSSSTLGIYDIHKLRAQFSPNFIDVPNLGVNNFTNWITLKIINNTANNNLMLTVSNPSIDKITMYMVHGDKIDSSSVHIDDPLYQRPIKHQFITFNLNMQQNDTAYCYLKVESTKQLLLPMTVGAKGVAVEQMLSYDLISGLYMGIMLTVILYNLFIYFGARDKHYLVFVHYIFWVSVVQLALLGFFPRVFQQPLLSNVKLVAFAGAMSGIASILFVQSFLNVKRYGKMLNLPLNIILVGDTLAILLLLIGFPEISYQIINLVAALGSLTVLVVASIVLFKGNQSAKLFLLAWGIFLGSVIVFVLKDYGILPYNHFTMHSVQLGVSIEALLLSFALADKINQYRREKEDSQLRELKILEENQQLIRTQNIALENKVKERTRDLTHANESLKSTLAHLKETQSQLVVAEKMASLGQLTAGVAHEINNPINFVTSNVTPLKRDVEILWQALEDIENLSLDPQSSPQEKLERISEYKQSIDLDYLKTEVEYLLKGMYEGASRTAEIVKSLRIFSRVDEDTLIFADLNEGLESTMVILNSLTKDKMQVIKDYGQIPFVECHAGKLNQVFLNILSNAIYAIEKRHGTSGQGELKIQTFLSSMEGFVEIKISDNGIGIPKELKEKIFEPFFTTKEVGEGTGLGMSIAYNTVDKHNGKIVVDSQLGMGTSFTIILPIKQDN